MMGRLEAGQERLFYHFRLEDQVPANHLLRKLDALLDLAPVRQQLERFYSVIGRPSVDPELMRRSTASLRVELHHPQNHKPHLNSGRPPRPSPHRAPTF
jgi:hypothetical protein